LHGLGPLFVLAVVALLLLPSADSSPTPKSAAPPVRSNEAGSPGAGGKGDAASALAAAESSLLQGEGPARGTSMYCDGLGSSLACRSSLGHLAGNTRGGDGGRNQSPRVVPGAYALPTPAAPPPRIGAATSIFLNGSKYGVLLFGGAPLSSQFDLVPYSDTWQFDPGTHSWWNVTGALPCVLTSSCPAARFGASMTYDYGDGYALLFGGCTNATNASVAGTQCPARIDGLPGLLSDTWQYVDLQGGVGDWVRTGYGFPPSPRYGAGLAYDWTDGFVLLYGGCSSRCPVADTWAFDQGRWFRPLPQPAPPGPPALYDFGMAALGVTQGVILFGGCRQAGAGCTGASHLIADTWQFAYGSWVQLRGGVNCTSIDPCPPARFLMGATSYDGPGLPPSVLLYGGLGAGGQVLGSATEGGGGWWEFTGPPFEWRQLNAPPGYTDPSQGWIAGTTRGLLLGNGSQASPPAPRFSEVLVGTPYGGVLLFGGESAAGTYLHDTWAASAVSSPPSFFPYSGLIAPYQTPPPAYGTGLVYDARDGYDLLVGGCSATCPTASVWSLAPYSAASRPQPWVPVLPSAPSAEPGARQGASLVYASAGGGEVLLFGGLVGASTFTNDLWQFREGQWSRVIVLGSPPPPRAYAAMAFDTVAGQVLLFGGLNASRPLGDTWVLSYLPFASAWTWTARSSARAPSARYSAAFAYDDAAGVVVLFGGCGSSCRLADTWTFDGMSWSKCTSTNCLSVGPSARYGASMAFDPATGTLVMYGGCSSTGCPSGETWSFDPANGGVWFLLLSSSPAPARMQAAMTYDPQAGALLLWGGIEPGGGVVGGMGAMFAGGTWSDSVAPRAAALEEEPLPVFGAQMVYDSARHVVVLFGGCPATSVNPSCSAGSLFASSWTYANGTWTIACTQCGPPPRWDAAMAYDAVDNYTVLFGGCPDIAAGNNSCAAPMNDTWIFRTSWTQLRLAHAPSVRADAAFGWDGFDRYDVLYGGWAGGIGGVNTSLNDTWTFVNGSWTQCVVATAPPLPACSLAPGSPTPGGLFGAVMATDPTTGLLYLYGGMGNPGGPMPSNALWQFIGLVGWNLLTHGPVAVYDAAMAFDANLGNLIVVGGLTSSGQPFDGTQLLLGYLPNTGYTWAVLTNPAPLGGRSGGSLLFLPSAGPDGADLWFGGAIGSAVPLFPGSTGAGQGDLWAFNEGARTWGDVTPFT
jgi:Galactose oxidase, central domain